MRNIQSIKVMNSNLVYFNFANGTFGTRRLVDGKWISHKITIEELEQGKKLALKEKKWTNWQAPHEECVYQSNRKTRCPDCGGYDCGSNCNSNYWRN